MPDAPYADGNDMRGAPSARVAGETGWHESRYNLRAQVPGSKNVAIVNLYRGTCAEFTPLELFLLSVVEDLDEHHPAIERFARRGVIANFDERVAIEAMGRAACALARGVSLVICPTLGCNFDCPYCYEDHAGGRMSTEVQNDVMALAERMLAASGSKDLFVTWYGGEPLLAPDVIEALSAQLMSLAEGRGGTYSAEIITNGYLLTQRMVNMLAAARIVRAQVSLDGLGPLHDATRHLTGGGPTFERITDNLRNCRIPFTVNVRHNVHAGNSEQVDELRAFVGELAAESGNDLRYYPAIVAPSAVADKRGEQVELLCREEAARLRATPTDLHLRRGRGHHCGAHSIWTVGIDEWGRLHKCWEAVDKPEFAFGTAHDWDPVDPLVTADRPDNLTRFLNTAMPFRDAECDACVWLPFCTGGCPFKRMVGQRSCTVFRNDPEGFVLALRAQLVGNAPQRLQPTERSRS